jgi:acylglycerol lipase
MMSLRIPAFALIPLALATVDCANQAYQPGRRAPAAAAGPSSPVRRSEARLASNDGLQLLTQSWTASPEGVPDNTKATVVIVHGLKDYSDRYDGLARRLAERRYLVHAFDLRGHGDSEGKRSWVDSFDDYVTDLDTVVTHARLKSPGKPVYLLGQSLGGAIVARYVLSRGPGVAGVILSAPTLKRAAKLTDFQVRAASWLGEYTPTLALVDLRNEDFSHDPARALSMASDPMVFSGRAPARAGKEWLGAMELIQHEQSKFNLPVLVLQGTEDPVANPEGGVDFLERCASKDKTLKTYPGLFHDLLHEARHEEVESDLIDWLERRNK